MPMFADRYRAAFEELGRPLKPTDAMTTEAIAAMPLEGLLLPLALHEYYLVAGNERVLNHSFNRLLAPDDVFVDSDRVCFMEENQAIVYWGVSGMSDDANPPLEQGINVDDALIEWNSENTDCAGFLETMLYWQASYGEGMSICASASVSPEIRSQLDRDFRFAGTIGELNTFGRKGCALSFLRWFGGEETAEWRVFGGFATKKLKTAIGKELDLQWDD
jgi:hypothetical protein